MKTKQLLVALLVAVCALLVVQAISIAQSDEAETAQESETPTLAPEDRLVIIWTSGDREVAEKMVFMYTFNSRRFNWWDDITFVIWGPSAKLITEDVPLQEYLAKIKEAGVDLKACKGCADMYGVSEKLEALGVEVKYMGEITDYIKEGRHVLTF